MSRSEDLVIIRGELANLTPEQLDAIRAFHQEARDLPLAWRDLDLPELLQRYREDSADAHLSPEKVRSGACPCPFCRFGRVLDELGLL